MQCKATALRPFGVEVGGIFDNPVGDCNVKETCCNIITSFVPLYMVVPLGDSYISECILKTN